MLLLVAGASSYYVILYLTLPLQSSVIESCSVSLEYADMKDSAKLDRCRENDCRCLSSGENLHPWGSSPPGSNEEWKPRTASSSAPRERETAADSRRHEPQLFFAHIKRGGERSEWRKAPDPPCTRCIISSASRHFTVTQTASGKGTRLSFLLSFGHLSELETGVPITQFPHLQNVHSAKYFMNF